MNTKNELAFRLLSIRAKKNITQAELAKELGISRSYLSCVENGHKQASEFLKMKILKMESEIPIFKEAIRLLIDADPSISDVDFNKYFKGFLKGYERGFNDAKERISPSFIEIFDLKNKGK